MCIRILTTIGHVCSCAIIMAANLSTQRDLRAFERICDGLVLKGLTTKQTAILLALAQCTGWSADRISQKIHDISGIKLTAETVWRFHRQWERRHGEANCSADTIEVMTNVLKRVGVDVSIMGTPLSDTVYPVLCSVRNICSP